MQFSYKRLQDLEELFLKENDPKHGVLWKAVVTQPFLNSAWICTTQVDVRTLRIRVQQPNTERCFRTALRSGDVIAFSVHGNTAEIKRISRSHKRGSDPKLHQVNYELVEGNPSSGLIPVIGRKLRLKKAA